MDLLADPAGRLGWASAALPGAVHDLTAARTHGLLDMLTANDITFADKAYQGTGGTVCTLDKLRCPRRATAIVAAILVLHQAETCRQPR